MVNFLAQQLSVILGVEITDLEIRSMQSDMRFAHLFEVRVFERARTERTREWRQVLNHHGEAQE